MITAQFGDLSAQKELSNDCTAKGLLNTTPKLLRWVDNLCLSLNHDRLIDFLSEIMVITKPTDTVDTLQEQRNKRMSLCIHSDDNIHEMKLPLGRIQYILKQIETR